MSSANRKRPTKEPISNTISKKGKYHNNDALKTSLDVFADVVVDRATKYDVHIKASVPLTSSSPMDHASRRPSYTHNASSPFLLTKPSLTLNQSVDAVPLPPSLVPFYVAHPTISLDPQLQTNLELLFCFLPFLPPLFFASQ